MSAASDDQVPEGYGPHDAVRWVAEPQKRSGRSVFARDRARVLHAASFRRLAAKTQIHVAGEADFPRTRLTHTLEVAQIGRELAVALGADPDLVDVAGLAHDLGHPPFGHNGEAALDDLARHIGGFEGNAQTLRVLTRLEAKRFGSPGPADEERSVGLNLSRAALDAVAKYPWPRRAGQRKFGAYRDDLEVFGWFRDGAPGDERCIEAQLMDYADDVAYSVHDLEDAVHAGHVDLTTLSAVLVPGDPDGVLAAAAGYAAASDDELLAAWDRLARLDYWPACYSGELRDQASLKNLASRLIGRFCAAAEEATRAAHPGRLTRYAGALHVPRAQLLEVAVLKAVANRYVMHRAGAAEVYAAQRELLHELADALCRAAPDVLDPPARRAYRSAPDDAARLRVVVDQLASLTDTSVVAWHDRLCRR